MTITPDRIYKDRINNSARPSWSANTGYINEVHRTIFTRTKDIPGWQLEGDSYKLYEMGYFAGDVILEVGTYGGRSAVVGTQGALGNKCRKCKPQFFGINENLNSIKLTYGSLVMYPSLADYCCLFHGTLEEFSKDFTIQPSMVSWNGDHQYERVIRDFELLSEMLSPGVPVLCHGFLNPEKDTGKYGIHKALTEWEGAGFGEFYGVFGSSALIVTTAKCKGVSVNRISSEEFIQRSENFLESYGLGKKYCLSSLRKIFLLPWEKRALHDDMSTSSQYMSILEWLKEMPEKNDIVFISEKCDYTHDETTYDHQYNIDPEDTRAGRGLKNLLRSRAADFSMPALEIGCGSGKLSLGLADNSNYPAVILTDPSTAFLNIVLQKLGKMDIDNTSVKLAVLKGEEIDRLPENSLSLIALRSALHHILDVPSFICDAAKALVPDGFLAFEEPCREGFVLMGTIAQFIPCVLERASINLSKRHLRQVNLFIDTMKLYSATGVDKSDLEDKHVFSPEEIMSLGAYAGLAVEFLPNMIFDQFFESVESTNDFFSFHHFFRDYLKYCMNFDEKLVEFFDKHLQPYNQFLEDLSVNNNAPSCHGVFLCRRL